MKTLPKTIGVGVLLACLAVAGCDQDHNNPRGTTTQKPVAEPPPPQGKKVPLGKNVWLEVMPDKTRRVLIESKVVLRESGMMLEHLLCKLMTKEHETILHADIDAEKVHAALLAAGADAGKPVQFDPKYMPASGTVIKVLLQFKDKNGKLVTEPAQNWIRNKVTKKPMHYDWVFAGSCRNPDPMDASKPGFYGANNGDVICIANFPTSLLDLPVQNENENTRLDFEHFTEHIPPLETPVTVILEPVLKKN